MRRSPVSPGRHGDWGPALSARSPVSPKLAWRVGRRSRRPWHPWAKLREVNLRLVRGDAPAQVADDLARAPETAASALLQEKLGDLYESAGKLTTAVDAYRRALTLKPTPQQRVRLQLGLAQFPHHTAPTSRGHQGLPRVSSNRIQSTRNSSASTGRLSPWPNR